MLAGRHVLAVAGTHGKTGTTAMLAWILEHAGRAPGFLVGGVPLNFGVSARLGERGDAAPFVIEADEYDTAFFDKRSKFVHYRPRTVILNNLEFDHADIFADLAAIETAVPPPGAHGAGEAGAWSSTPATRRCSACSRWAAGASCSASARARRRRACCARAASRTRSTSCAAA